MADTLGERWSQALSVPSDESLDLALLAVLIAKAEYTSLDIEATLSIFDELAEEVMRAGGELDDLRRVLFEEHKFRGNQDDYYTAANSYINEVLRLRVGIPITLCVVLMEVGARCNQALAPVSFPGHFLARTQDPDGNFQFIDAFHGGAAQDEETLVERLRQLTGRADLPDAFVTSAFTPCPRREVVARMLRNLKQIYIHSRDWPRALRVTDQLLHVQPGQGEHYRDRGQLYAQIGHTAAAQADLSRYLQMITDIREKERVRKFLGTLASKSQPLN